MSDIVLYLLNNCLTTGSFQIIIKILLEGFLFPETGKHEAHLVKHY